MLNGSRHDPEGRARIFFAKLAKLLEVLLFLSSHNHTTEVLTEFAKYEGAGNDFILIDNREGGFTPD